MTNSKRHIALLALVTFLACVSTGAILRLPGQLSASEARGKRIFLEGKSESGVEIKALLSGSEVPATVLPCGSCHGADGRGNPEGGVVPSDIRYEALSRAYQQSNAQGRQHPPYDEKTLKRAIAMGIDPAGNPLNPAMPKYQLSQADMDDLIAYLKKVGDDLDPGLDARSIKVAALLPPGGLNAELPKACAGILRAYCTHVNNGGGVYRRQLEPVFWSEVPGGASAPDWIAQEQPFALFSSFLGEEDQAIRNALQNQKVPLVGAISGRTENSGLRNRYVFYLCSGTEAHAKALLDSQFPGGQGKVLIMHAPQAGEVSLAERILSPARARGLTVQALPWPQGGTPATVAAAIRASEAEAVLFLGGGDLDALGKQLAISGAMPHFLIPGVRMTQNVLDLPPVLDGKLTIAYPTWASQVTDLGLKDLKHLQQQGAVTERFANVQMLCVASAKLLVEGLQRCGNMLTRERLVSELEKTTAYKTGLLPDLTYTKNRRVGTEEVFLVVPDLKAKRLNLKDNG
jgi:ABC-type branched-subunit amino acid transport system substrate-binding protein